MKRTRRIAKTQSAEAIAKMAERGEDISSHFTNRGKMTPPIQRVNLDFAADMLSELDQAAEKMNISRQAVIKTLVRLGFNGHFFTAKQKKMG
jgi:hypothetical protein